MPDQRTLSRIVSTVVPLIVLGLVSYASYTFVKTLCGELWKPYKPSTSTATNPNL